jgi:hypothetical protein
MSFRKPYLILRETAGEYVDGVWQAGARLAMTVQASVQPMPANSGMQPLPEGRRLSDFRKVYCALELQVTSTDDAIQPDIIVSEGWGYELTDVDANQSGVINHYRYTAAKIFKFTSEADWLAGNLVRP